MITDNVPEGRKNFALRDFARDMFYDGVAWDNRLFQRLRPHTLGVQRATQSFGWELGSSDVIISLLQQTSFYIDISHFSNNDMNFIFRVEISSILLVGNLMRFKFLYLVVFVVCFNPV
jgi:hypothetical protein